MVIISLQALSTEIIFSFRHPQLLQFDLKRAIWIDDLKSSTDNLLTEHSCRTIPKSIQNFKKYLTGNSFLNNLPHLFFSSNTLSYTEKEKFLIYLYCRRCNKTEKSNILKSRVSRVKFSHSVMVGHRYGEMNIVRLNRTEDYNARQVLSRNVILLDLLACYTTASSWTKER